MKKNHFQVRNITLPNPTTVTFCYHNTRKDDGSPTSLLPKSSYGVYIVDKSGAIGAIDPIISNGTNN